MAKLIINGLEANVATKDYTAFHGNSVFTTMRSQEGQILHWSEHYERLKTHGDHFTFLVPSKSQFESAILSELKNCTCDQKIRVLLSENAYAITLEDYTPPQAFIYNGVSCMLSKHQPHPQYQHLKTGNSLPYQLAMREAQEHQVFESLLIDYQGLVVDGSRTSIMYCNEKSLYGLSGGLDGIMRKIALRHAENMGLAVDMKPMTKQEFKNRLANQEGQFLLANSLIGVVSVGAPRFGVVREIIERFRML